MENRFFQPTITNDEIVLLPRAWFPGDVEVIETWKDYNEACGHLLTQKVIGFDTETKPSFAAGVVNKIALLQLSTADRCFLFRLCRMRFEQVLIDILENPDIIKVGIGIRDDLRGLQALHQFKPGGFIDLQSILGQWGIEDMSLRKVAALVLGLRVSKAQRLSNWEANVFTEAQTNYAATDAWACLEIYNKLMASPKRN